VWTCGNVKSIESEFRLTPLFVAVTTENGTGHRGMNDDGLVRSAWQQALANWSQAFVGSITLEDPLDWIAAAALNRIPPTSTCAEIVLLKSTLLGIGLHFMAVMHSREKPQTCCSCWREGSRSLSLLMDPSPGDAMSSFREWLLTFVEIYRRHHRTTIAEEAAHLVRLRAPQRVSVAELARHCHCGLRTLQRVFRARFGRSLTEYQRIARLIAIASQLREQTKIDALAVDAGYRSKKDFYRAFSRVIGSTPGRFRALPQAQRTLLLASIRDSLMMRRAAAPTS
jgi:AraC-like DNA-binding protein